MTPDVVTVFQNNTVVTEVAGAAVLGAMFDQRLPTLPAGAKGDPGGNVMAAGLFAALGALTVPAGTKRIQTTGNTVVGKGAAFYTEVGSGPASATRKQDAGGRWFELDEALVDPKMLAAAADGSDDSAAVNAAMAKVGATGSVHLSSDVYVTDALNPVKGVRFEGPGRLLKPQDGGVMQLTSYADEGKLFFGREYLLRVHANLKIGQQVLTYFFGDSRGAQGNGTITGSISGTTLTVTTNGAVLVNIGSTISGTGITTCRVTGFGTGKGSTGTYTVSASQTVSSRSMTVANGGSYAGVEGQPERIIPRILKRKGWRKTAAGDPGIYIINRAIGGSTVADWAPLPDIDTTTGTTDLFIVDFGPNNPAMGLDAYAATVDAKLSAIRALPAGSPQQLTILWIGGGSTFKPSVFQNNLWPEQIRAVDVALCRKHHVAYYDGYADRRDVAWAVGAPEPKLLDDLGVHPAEIMQATRYANVLDAFFGYSDLVLWDNDDLVGLGGSGSWTNYTTGSDGFSVAACSMDREGWVTVQGDLKSGATAQYTQVATLPAGYWPDKNLTFTVHVSDGGANTVAIPVLVTIAGAILLLAAAPYNGRLSLGGIRFRTR